MKRRNQRESGESDRGCGYLLGIVVLVLVVLYLFFNKSPIPPNIQVDFRGSLIGAGKVMMLSNRSGDHYYNVRVKIRGSKGDSASVIADSDLAPSETSEVGWLQFGNWVVEPGETVYISTDSNPIPLIKNVPR